MKLADVFLGAEECQKRSHSVARIDLGHIGILVHCIPIVAAVVELRSVTGEGRTRTTPLGGG
jgi:hypothetical protein